MKWVIRNWLLDPLNYSTKLFFTEESDSQLGQQCQTANNTIDLNNQVSPTDILNFFSRLTYLVKGGLISEFFHLGGHLTTAWNKFIQFWPPHPPQVNKIGHFTYYLPFVTWSPLVSIFYLWIKFNFFNSSMYLWYVHIFY